MQVNHIVTVSHGTASLGEIMRAVMAYYDDLPPMMGRAPMEMTVVCLDEDDYTDATTMPRNSNSSLTTARAPTEVGVRTRASESRCLGLRNGGRLRPALGVWCTLRKQRSRFDSGEGHQRPSA